MKKYIILIFILIISCCYISCNQRQQEIKKIIKTWNGKKIIFPPLTTKIMGRDTIIPDILNHKYKILTYIDTTGCTACRLKLFDWKLFINELNNLSTDVAIIFVIHSENYRDFEEIQKLNKFFYPVFYDYNAELDNLNHFPKDPDFQTFLLDQADKVLIIGNPIMNDAVRLLYEKIIKKDT